MSYLLEESHQHDVSGLPLCEGFIFRRLGFGGVKVPRVMFVSNILAFLLLPPTLSQAEDYFHLPQYQKRALQNEAQPGLPVEQFTHLGL